MKLHELQIKGFKLDNTIQTCVCIRLQVKVLEIQYYHALSLLPSTFSSKQQSH